MKVPDWTAINATDWQKCKEQKQAEFLVESTLPWSLVEEIGVYSPSWAEKVREQLQGTGHKPIISVKRDWYY
jgi:hypothetical protein